MEYWTEYCPRCGAVVGKRSSLYSGGGYGSPIETCQSCGAQYLNTNIIELALVDKKEYPKMMFGGLVNNGIRLAMLMFWIWLIGYGIAEWIMKVSYPDDAVAKILFAIWTVIILKNALFTRKWFYDELNKSKERLKDKEYRELLRRSCYNPDLR